MKSCKMCSLLLALLDRIEIEKNPGLAKQRFKIGEDCGYTVTIEERTSGRMQ